MSVLTKIRRGEGPGWRFLKSFVRKCLSAHVPVNVATRPLFGFLYALHVATRELLGASLRFAWYEPLFRSQCYTVGPMFRMEKLPYITGKGKIVIGEDVEFSGKPGMAFGNRHFPAPELIVGDRVFIGHGCNFSIARSITIGNDCLIAGGSSIRDNDGHSSVAAERRLGIPASSDAIKPVIIGNDVWIGAGVRIMKGVRIGDRSIIAAGAIVTADIPEDVVAAGIPARVVRNNPPKSL